MSPIGRGHHFIATWSSANTRRTGVPRPIGMVTNSRSSSKVRRDAPYENWQSQWHPLNHILVSATQPWYDDRTEVPISIDPIPKDGLE